MPFAPSEFWASKAPDAVLDYSFDATNLITLPDGTVDIIVSASIATMPSGLGELTPTSLTVTGTILTATLSGGVSGRVYVHKLIFTTNGGNRTYEVFIGQVCNPLLANIPIPPPPSGDFGPPVMLLLEGFDLSQVSNSAYIALLAGF